MPYITQDDRRAIREGSIRPVDFTAGQLNYAISVLMNEWLEKQGLSYTNVNTLVGMLECAKMELYRRVAAQYEDNKIKENGDVYIVPRRANDRDS